MRFLFAPIGTHLTLSLTNNSSNCEHNWLLRKLLAGVSEALSRHYYKFFVDDFLTLARERVFNELKRRPFSPVMFIAERHS